MHSTRPKQRSAHPQPGPHKQRHANWLRLFLPLALLIFGCFTPTPPPPSDPSVSTTGITLLGRTSALAPGSKASFLVQLRQPYGGAVLAGKPVDVRLVSADGTELASDSGETSRDGLVAMNFDLADDAPIGNATFSIYIFHTIGMAVANRLASLTPWDEGIAGLIVLKVLLGMFLPIALEMGIRRSHLLSTLFLGESWKTKWPAGLARAKSAAAE